MNKNYYCLVAGLPDISLEDEKLIFSANQFKKELEEFMDKADFQQISQLYLPYDNKNLLNLLLKSDEPFHNLGNYSMTMLEEEIKEPTRLPAYMRDFILNYKEEQTNKTNAFWEKRLNEKFYAYESNGSNMFLKKWFTFDQDLKNIITALNCRKHNIPVEENLIGKNELNEQLIKKSGRDFGISNEYLFLEKLLFAHEKNNPLETEIILNEIRWQWVDEHTFFEYFTTEKIMGFVIKLGILERWVTLSPTEGKRKLQEILINLQEAFTLDESFEINRQKVSR